MDNEDKQLIAEFGLTSFSEAQQIELLSQYYETLDLYLSMALEERLSDEQLAEFEELHDAGDDAATLTWLKQTIGDYDRLVADETAAVKAAIKRSIGR
jgi:hypothetical protein